MDSASEPTDNLSPLKRAILEIRETRARIDELEYQQNAPVAVVGIGCRYPGGADNPDALWHLLQNGVDTILEVPQERWNADAYYDPDPTVPGKIASRWGGFLQQKLDRFEPQFFGITPREAMSMDPQQRLMLEVSWEALEHAGQSPERLANSRTGVFVGISTSDYVSLRLMAGKTETIDSYLSTGLSHSVASGRISYVLGLQGPSVSLDTACSSSLVTVHLAVQSLRNDECRMALAGGVNLTLMPELTMTLSKSRMMAADGRCKAFDARADGFVRSEGCGVVVLKRLSDALEDGDNILAVIRGTATNQDGRSNGPTAPNGPAQEAVIRAALRNGSIKPQEVDYVETHGTGTSLGDPIEVQALGAVYGRERPEDRPLLIGSVKTNLGHTEAAAGVAGLIKAVLALQHREIPPHLHLQELNPYIHWEDLPIQVPTERTSWPARGEPQDERRIAGVSSFGFSGTNVHVVLESAPRATALPALESETANRPQYLLALSARNETALKELAVRYRRHLEMNPSLSPEDLCFTANTGRAHLPYRLAIISGSGGSAVADIQEKLGNYTEGQETVGVLSGTVLDTGRPEVVFMFTGHGAQHVNMGRHLYETQPTFRQAVDECDTLLRQYLERPLISILYPDSEKEEVEAARLMDGMTYSQPALFAVEYALARMWIAWGIEPAAVMGHSVGEYVAACIAGVFSLADGLKLVAARGTLMDSLPQQGEMAAIFAAEDKVAAAIAPYADHASIAAINGPKNVVISGATTVIQEVIADLKADGIKSRRLAVAQASHSPLLDSILDAFEKTAVEVVYSPPHIALISGVSGRLVEEAEVTNAGYWRRHLRQPVRFAESMQSLHEEGYSLFVEAGPSPVLAGMGKRCLAGKDAFWFPSLRPGWGDWQQMLESLAGLYVRGVKVDWDAFEGDYARRRIALPTYPWQRGSYWLEEVHAQQHAGLPDEGSVWESIAASALHQSRRSPIELSMDGHAAAWAALDRLSLAYRINALRSLGVFTRPGEKNSAESMLDQFGVEFVFVGLLGRWLESLVEEGLLQQQEDGSFTNPQPLPAVSIDPLLKEARKLCTDGPYLPDYVERCGQMLIDVLTGAEGPLETLFPGGSYETVDYLYHSAPFVRYFNDIGRAAVEALLRGWPKEKELRILEIGAGTGGTTASLLPVLPAERTTYYYTDLSEFFFNRAEQRFSAYPFMRYGILDIERPAQDQGYGQHGFNLIVAANVLHATRDLDLALQNVASQLAPGGVLILFETTTQPPWFETSIGLIEGWSRFEDKWRKGDPLLTPEQWQSALQANGFQSVSTWPEAGSVAEVLGAHIIIAQVPVAESHLAGYVPTSLDSDDRQEAGGRRIPDEEDESLTAEVAEAFLRQLREATSGERYELLIDYVRGHVIKVTRTDPSQPPHPRHRLMDIGVDSLMAIELSNRLATGLGMEGSLTATLVFDYPTIEAVSNHLAELLDMDQDEAEDGQLPETKADETTAGEVRIEDLSEEEVEEMLLKKLEKFQ